MSFTDKRRVLETSRGQKDLCIALLFYSRGEDFNTELWRAAELWLSSTRSHGRRRRDDDVTTSYRSLFLFRSACCFPPFLFDSML